MAIKIKKDESGTVARVIGADVPPLPLNSFVCEATAETGLITLFSPDRDLSDNGFYKVFNNIHFSEFEKSDGTAPVDVLDLKADLDAQLAAPASTSVATGYKGLYNADTNVPDIATDIDNYENGDWFFVSASGTQNSVDYGLNDQVKLVVLVDGNGDEVSRTWDLIPDVSAKVSEIENSALDQFDIHVDSEYLGSLRTGSSLQPLRYPSRGFR